MSTRVAKTDETPIAELVPPGQTREQQATVMGSVSMTGPATFSGERSALRLEPSGPDAGISIRMPSGTSIPCTIDSLRASDVHTTELSAGGERYKALEHLTAALYALGITNCTIVAEQNVEIPNPSAGSCRYFVERIQEIGIKRQFVPARTVAVRSESEFAWERSSAQVRPPLEGQTHLHLQVAIEFPEPIGRQLVRWSSDPDSALHSLEEFSNARSFIRRGLDDVRLDGRSHFNVLRESVKGLPGRPEDLKHMAFTDGRWVVEPSYPNEPAWHKLMDFVGDLSLLGSRLLGNVDVKLPGHAFNHRFVYWLLGRLDPELPITARLD